MDGNSAKFWQVEVDGGVLRVTWGRIGTDGRTTEKALGAAAQAEADKRIREKTKKGYVEVSNGPGPLVALKALGAGGFPSLPELYDPAAPHPVAVELWPVLEAEVLEVTPWLERDPRAPAPNWPDERTSRP